MSASNLKAHSLKLPRGIRANLIQFSLQLIQVFFVGLTLGMTRTVVPAVAEREYGLPKDSMGLIATFVVAFGVVKAVMNFAAGRTSEKFGRKNVLVFGWLVALPIPFMIRYGMSWNWFVAATVLLGINQGLAWSMTLTSKLDLTRPDQRGLANGLNECCGYFAVAVAGVVTGYLSDELGARVGLFIFGLAVIVPALMMALLLVRDTRAVAAPITGSQLHPESQLSSVSNESHPGSRRDPAIGFSFVAICQAGLIEKFTDSLMWLIVPVSLTARGMNIADIGWIPGIYATVWGVSQLFTGPISDRVGRKPLIVAGMFMCSIGTGLMVMLNQSWWWSMCAAITGLGMGLVYPTLGAAVSDIAPPNKLGRTLGLYRFWRDLGYAVGALALAIIARQFGEVDAAFIFVSIAMTASGLVFLLLAKESRSTRLAH